MWKEKLQRKYLENICIQFGLLFSPHYEKVMFVKSKIIFIICKTKDHH
jgi:hypothetical protein